MTSNKELRRSIRSTLGRAVLEAQDKHKDLNPGVVIPEIIAALLSLANNIARKNANLSTTDFLRACIAAAEEDAPDGQSRPHR